MLRTRGQMQGRMLPRLLAWLAVFCLLWSQDPSAVLAQHAALQDSAISLAAGDFCGHLPDQGPAQSNHPSCITDCCIGAGPVVTPLAATLPATRFSRASQPKRRGRSATLPHVALRPYCRAPPGPKAFS